ncbi:MAG: TIGR04255 family protein, partial [Chloroflexi bacterium]|nr:TIGR04255 family protein [Chloroflexota bacterium]
MTLALLDRSPASFQATLQFESDDDARVVMRYGALTGQAVGNTPLRRREIEASGPYFLVDIDSYRASELEFMEFSVDGALEMCDRLHHPVRELFESAITDRLRDEILRRPANVG